MGLVENEGQQLYRCVSCSGLLLSEAAFEDLQKENDNHLKGLLTTPEKAPKKNRGTRSCPVCTKKMKVTDFDWNSEIEIDVCEECSQIWLDGGEMKLIHEHLKKEHPEMIDTEMEHNSKKIFGWTQKLLITLSKYSPRV